MTVGADPLLGRAGTVARVTTLREKLTTAGLSDEKQLAHLEAGFLAVGGERVDSLDVEVPDGAGIGIYPWPPLSAEERAAVEAEIAAVRKAREDAKKAKAEPSGW